MLLLNCLSVSSSKKPKNLTVEDDKFAVSCVDVKGGLLTEITETVNAARKGPKKTFES